MKGAGEVERYLLEVYLTNRCNLDCTYCSAGYMVRGKQRRVLPFERIQQALDVYAAVGAGGGRPVSRKVFLTGGEPLLQDDTPELITRLLDDNFEVMVETNGSLDIGSIDERAVTIMDIKCPTSGATVLWSNIGKLKPLDEAKFVISGHDDYLWAVRTMNKFDLPGNATVLMYPVFGKLDPRQLAEWMLQDKLDKHLILMEVMIRLMLQI